MSKERQVCHQVPVPALQPSQPLVPRWDTPVVCVLSLGMHAVLNGFFSFSNIQFKDLLVRLINLSNLNHSCARLFETSLLARIPLFWKTAINPGSWSSSSSQHYFYSWLWSSHSCLWSPENMASAVSSSFVLSIEMLELLETCFGILHF